MSTVKILAAWILLAGCAVGANDEPDIGEFQVPNYLQDAGPSGAGGAGGAGGMSGGSGGTAGTPMFDGDPCTQGQTEACACEGSGMMGQRICMANTLSPTGGEFTECQGCPAVDPDGGMMTGGAGGMTGGAGGMTGGAGGMTGGAGGMTGGAGGMTGGAGGMTGGAGGTMSCMCTDPLACCRDDGSCGVGIPGLCL